MRKLNSKGFSPVEILLVLVIVGLLGFAGWYVWKQRAVRQSNHNDSNSSQSDKRSQANQETENEDAPEAETKKCEPKTVTTAIKNGYLEINEHSVRFKINSEIQDAYYYVSSDCGISFSTKYFDNVKDAEYCVASDGSGLAYLSRAKAGDENFGTPWAEEDFKEFNNVKIGEHHYWIRGNQAPCTEKEPYASKAGELGQHFIDAGETIEAIP